MLPSPVAVRHSPDRLPLLFRSHFAAPSSCSVSKLRFSLLHSQHFVLFSSVAVAINLPPLSQSSSHQSQW
ncbi:hypothetical protein K1719_024536 [Acacia pycnantha]|nr:hypothetical protein K1719_024536 [Acacia pycnantha]